MTKTHKTESEQSAYRAMFARDAEYAARVDRAIWRGECVGLALLAAEDSFGPGYADDYRHAQDCKCSGCAR